MRSQPNRDYVSNDDIQTPLALARRLVAHFQPTGKILEPCRGHGNFLKARPARASAEFSTYSFSLKAYRYFRPVGGSKTWSRLL